MLRTVVIPLEEEIDLLRIQLREAQERLEIYEDNVCTCIVLYMYLSCMYMYSTCMH